MLDSYRNPEKRPVTKVIPDFSWPALIFAFSIPLALLGNSLISGYGIGSDKLLNSPRVWIIPWWLIFVFLSMLPLLIALSGFILKKGDKKYFGLLFQKLPEQQLSFGQPNPTSVHYRKLFHNMMESALNGETKRVFIIVLDNLDRIEPRMAFQMLATMKTFMDPFGGDQKEWLKRLWLIVPLDLTALESFWTGTGEKLNSAPTLEPEQTEIEYKNGRNSLVRSFLDKQFQVIFDVPSPVLLRWKKFFLEKLRCAFADQEISDEEFETTFHVFDLIRRSETRPPTPRDIILFIN